MLPNGQSALHRNGPGHILIGHGHVFHSHCGTHSHLTLHAGFLIHDELKSCLLSPLIHIQGKGMPLISDR